MALDPANGNSFAASIPPPQNPFLPLVAIQGPSFLDTEACLCALQETPESGSRDAVWQCIGDQQDDVYETNTGKWFRARDAEGEVDGNIDNDSNPPRAEEPLVFDSDTSALESFENEEQLKLENRFCTGRNRTSFTTSFYRAAEQLENDEDPVDAVPCFKPPGTALPVRIQNAESWLENGCLEGFLCTNNTVNSLPQYCPPVTACQLSRLAGEPCQFEGRNIGNGLYEPVVCQEGWYCPPPGNETIRCPAGSYCQPGAPTPTPCLTGSWCPEGSSNELFLVPIVLLILIDVAIIAALIVHKFRNRSGKRRDGLPRLNNFWGRRKAKLESARASNGMARSYKQLEDDDDDDEDTEMVPMDATYMPGRDGWTGFQAALDMENMHNSMKNNANNNRNMQLKRAETFNPQIRNFVESMKRATDATELGLSFGYTELSFQPKKAPKPILHNVTGCIERGSLVGVMGGSGAGKSTFVNVLMGKTTNTGGKVSINDVPGKIKRYKKLIGYVPQDDVVIPEMTVRENMAHSARIRLPRTWTAAEIDEHVDSVVDCLELSHVRDSLVGTVGKPVISGGQRKRVSIGMELAAAPMAIFLDEPTSGLDATAASSIVLTLKALARLGISVIVIIHQPRAEIFNMLDDLILLGDGQTIYEGPQADVSRYFGNLGFSFPPHGNEGDVVTDIITGNGRQYKTTGDISKEALINHWAASRAALGRSDSDNDDHDNASLRPTSVFGAGAGTSSPGRGRLSFASSDSQARSNRKSMRVILKRRGAPRLKQTWLCLKRAMLQQGRLKSAFFFEMGMAVLAGFLIGLAHEPRGGVLFKGFYNGQFSILSLAADANSASQFALLQAIAIGLVCGAPGVKVFSEEMVLHRREAEAGHSRSAYFAAKVVSVVPRMVLGCLHFTTLTWMLARPVVNYGIGFAANLLYFYCVYGLAACVSMVVRREDAPLLSTMVSLVVGLLSGAAPPLSSVKDWHLEWLWRASPGTWLAEMYFGKLVEPFKYLYRVDMVADQVGYDLGVTDRNFLLLLGIGTIYRVLAYLGLFFGGRLRR